MQKTLQIIRKTQEIYRLFKLKHDKSAFYSD